MLPGRQPQVRRHGGCRGANERPIVLVQDYHFALLPRLIRERLPEAIIITFWHIPWPNSEVFSVCPWRERDPRRAARQLDPRLPHPVPLQQFHRERRSLPGNPHRPRRIGDLLRRPDDAGPCLSDLDRMAGGPAGRLPAVGGSRAPSSQRYGLPADIKLASASSASTTPRAFSTVSTRWTSCSTSIPDWIGQVVFLQIAAPSRGTLPAYKQLHQECLRLRRRDQRALRQRRLSADRAGRRASRPGAALRALPRRRHLRGHQPA